VRVALGALKSFAAITALIAGAGPGHAETAGDPGLTAFRAWLDREHPGYGCDAGPAPFRNKTVEAAYPGQHFYYVLTFTRGIPPPFPNGISVVVSLDDSGHVVPFSPRSSASYGRGLKRIASAKDAKLAAAAVSIVASCDPREARWPYRPDRFKVRKNSRGWTCTYPYDGNYASWVVFDKKSRVIEIGGSSPPVP
jgi:hypothetical protein